MGKFDKYECEGQISIFDFLQQDKEDAHSSPDDLKAQGFINMYDMTPPPGLYEVCDINSPNIIWQANRHENVWENPKGKRMSHFRPIPGEWLKGHGKRIFFDDIKEGGYYLADLSTESMKCYKVAYVKQKVENDLHYVDSPKGIKGEWNWGNSYSCLTRKQYVDTDNSNLAGASATNGYWYEIGPMITETELLNTEKEDLITESVSPQEEYKESVNKQLVTKHTCKHSEHECNKEELWKVADSLDETQCPHVCCRQCNTRGCGARCNGSKEPEQPNLCQDCIFQWLEIPNEGFGCHYDTNKNICCKEKMYKASEGWHLVKARPPYTVPMELPTNKNWEPVQVLLYNSEYDLYVVGDHWQAKDNTFKSYLPEPFGGVVAWRYKKEKKKNET